MWSIMRYKWYMVWSLLLIRVATLQVPHDLINNGSYSSDTYITSLCYNHVCIWKCEYSFLHPYPWFILFYNVMNNDDGSLEVYMYMEVGKFHLYFFFMYLVSRGVYLSSWCIPVQPTTLWPLVYWLCVSSWAPLLCGRPFLGS